MDSIHFQHAPGVATTAFQHKHFDRFWIRWCSVVRLAAVSKAIYACGLYQAYPTSACHTAFGSACMRYSLHSAHFSTSTCVCSVACPAIYGSSDSSTSQVSGSTHCPARVASTAAGCCAVCTCSIESVSLRSCSLITLCLASSTLVLVRFFGNSASV